MLFALLDVTIRNKTDLLNETITKTNKQKIKQIVNAGDAVAALPTDGSALRVGPGLQVASSQGGAEDEEYLVTARPGILRQTKGGKLWVEARSRR